MNIYTYRVVAVILLLLCALPCQVLATVELPLKADTSKKCAICHYQWVSTFFLEHRNTPIAKADEKSLETFSREMCISCHDASVRDSRSTICNDPGHKVGRVPSKLVNIPSDFPLDESGALKCTTCHTPHAVTEESESMVEYFLRAPNENSSFCKMCHKQMLGGLAKGNHPIDVSVNANTDIILRGGGKFGTSLSNQIICETCHRAHGGVNSKRLVLPVENIMSMSVLCEVCHTRNATKPGVISGKTHSHPVDTRPGKGVQIPATWANGEKVVTGSRGELVCRTCHKPHHAADRAFLLAEFKEKDSLCVQCHRDHARIAGSPHDLKISAPEYTNMLGETSNHAGLCSPCHSVHNANEQKFIWSAPLGPSKLEGWNGEHTADTNLMVMICTGCHSEGNIAQDTIPLYGLHPQRLEFPAEKQDVINRVNKKFPIYSNEGEVTTEGNIVCSTCHNPHQWDPRNHINGREVQAEGTATTSFLRAELCERFCAVCHGEDSLVKFTYFHRSTGRKKEGSLFPPIKKDIKNQ